MFESCSALNIISNVGFPIFIAVWFMWRIEKIIENNTKVLTEIKEFLQHLKDH